MLKIIDNYTLTKLIGKGSYGKVYHAFNHQTQQQVAIKVIPLNKFQQNPKLIQLTKQQISIINSLESNSNVIKFIDIIKSNRFLYLIYEYCEEGTLEEYMLKKHNKLTEKQALMKFRQLINAMKGLYDKNIIHRDIKPDNIFLKKGQLKLADFGFCKQLLSSDDLTQTSLGSPLYMAPQILNQAIYNTKADVWSCGIVLYQMLYGQCPYGTCNIKQLLNQYQQSTNNDSQNQFIRLPSYPKVSAVVEGMLNRMLCKDQFKRISWEEYFYEYYFDERTGELKHKQKDFEYDLMRLMKRNSSTMSQNGNSSDGRGSDVGSQTKIAIHHNSVSSRSIQQHQPKISISTASLPKRKPGVIKFDWQKLTEINDLSNSVHSEQCNNQQQQRQHQAYLQQCQDRMRFSCKPPSLNRYMSSHDISPRRLSKQQQQQKTQQTYNYIRQIYLLKKKIKQFQQQHSKALQMVNIIEQMLDQSPQSYHYDTRILYFLVWNLQFMLKMNKELIWQYIRNSKPFIEKSNLYDEGSKLQKLKNVFDKEYENIKPKLNNIKSILLCLQQTQSLMIFKYPLKKSVLRENAKQYIENYEIQCDGVLDLSNQRGNRIQCIRLVRVLWGLNVIKQYQGFGNGDENKRNNDTGNGNDKKTIKNNQPKPTTFTTSITSNNTNTNANNIFSIKQSTQKRQISAMINSFLVEMGI